MHTCRHMNYIFHVTHDFVDSKVNNLNLPLSVYDNVCGLDVTMRNVVCVKVCKAIKDFTHHCHKLLFKEYAVGGKGSLEGATAHVLHEDCHITDGHLERAMKVIHMEAINGMAKN